VIKQVPNPKMQYLYNKAGSKSTKNREHADTKERD
jgi:hypothetical protein